MNYEFAGWEFRRTDITGKPGVLVLGKELPNPHPKNAILSYKQYRESTDPREAAAWLISHWYEHALDLCPCQQGEENNSSSLRFRHACMATLLEMNP